ncbi:hypothetical protein H0H87_009194 [Tephrocybe sp. NHM501043]|nr:hypothetical protein H0H87_009194 [Tephrocybe sp. NHM501043]
MYPQDPKMWVTDVAPIGALRAWVEGNRTTPPPTYLLPKMDLPPRCAGIRSVPIA